MQKILTSLLDAVFLAENAIHPGVEVKAVDEAYRLLNAARKEAEQAIEDHLNGVSKEQIERREQVLQKIYSKKPEDIHRLLWDMDMMPFSELNELISAGITYEEPHNAGGFCMPRWMSDTDGFNMYNRFFTILNMFKLMNGKKLIGVRIIVEDIDDGDNSYTLDCHGHDPVADDHMADNLIRIFREEFQNKSVLDVVRLKEMLKQYDFQRQ